MKILTFTELTTPNDQTLRFTSLGLSTAGKLSPEDAAEFQQQCIEKADLVKAVPDSTRQSFERLRTLHAYGVLCYDAFTVAGDLSWVVLEQALRERFVDFYGGAIPLVDRDGTGGVFDVPDFDAIAEAFGRGGSRSKGWRLKPHRGTGAMRMPTTLRPLLGWARHEGLLEGQRNRRVENELFHRMRNRFAHGSGYHLAMPPDSARTICDLAEIINRLWGETTPGGRLYPQPLVREIIVIGWSSGWTHHEKGSALVEMRPDQLNDFEEDQGDWTYIVLRGVPSDRDIRNIDPECERTTYPADILWGPGPRRDASAWLQMTVPIGDEVTYFDRLFALRRDNGQVYMPCRLGVMRLLPKDRRGGIWHIVRADFPGDALAHVRHFDGPSCRRTERFGGCAVEEIFEGPWQEAIATEHVRLEKRSHGSE